MLNDISLVGVSAAHIGDAPAVGQRSPAAEPAPATLIATPIVNPTLRLDAALGLVVIEFRNETGEITTSIPSQRQLQAYQRWETTQIRPDPAETQRLDKSDQPSGTNTPQIACDDRGRDRPLNRAPGPVV